MGQQGCQQHGGYKGHGVRRHASRMGAVRGIVPTHDAPHTTWVLVHLSFAQSTPLWLCTQVMHSRCLLQRHTCYEHAESTMCMLNPTMQFGP